MKKIFCDFCGRDITDTVQEAGFGLEIHVKTSPRDNFSRGKQREINFCTRVAEICGLCHRAIDNISPITAIQQFILTERQRMLAVDAQKEQKN